MKNILCYGDSNMWGFIPGSYNYETCLAQRFTKHQRWLGILQNSLGESYHIIEDAVNGRTTMFDEKIPGRLYRNGLTHLPFCLEAHYPIDLIIFMLGTNDTKIQYNKTADEIGEGIRQLIKLIKVSNKVRINNLPPILIIAPHHVTKSAHLSDQYDETSIKKSRELAPVYKQISLEENCEFLDAAEFVTSSGDGVHLDELGNKLLANAVAKKVSRMLQ